MRSVRILRRACTIHLGCVSLLHYQLRNFFLKAYNTHVTDEVLMSEALGPFVLCHHPRNEVF